MALTARQVTVASTATLLTTPPVDSLVGAAIQVVNRHAANSTFLGAAGVTIATGYELKAGEAVSFRLDVGEALYGITAVTGTVHVLETGL